MLWHAESLLCIAKCQRELPKTHDGFLDSGVLHIEVSCRFKSCWMCAKLLVRQTVVLGLAVIRGRELTRRCCAQADCPWFEFINRGVVIGDDVERK